MKKLLLLSLVPFLLSNDAFSQSAAETPLKNPGFEGTYAALPTPADTSTGIIKGAVADGWSDNSDWADLAVDYAADTKEPHGGVSSQQVAVTRITKGVVQLIQHVDFVAGHEYSFSVWLRGDSGAKVSLALRQATEPYNTYKETPVTLSTEWSEFTVSGIVPDDTKGFLMIIANTPVTFSVDDARLEEGAK